jgi:hypothetical protein
MKRPRASVRALTVKLLPVAETVTAGTGFPRSSTIPAMDDVAIPAEAGLAKEPRAATQAIGNTAPRSTRTNGKMIPLRNYRMDDSRRDMGE